MSTVSIEPGSYQVAPPQNPGEVIALIRKHAIQVVDLRFTDLPGMWQHFSITLPEVNDDLFSAGIGFDGSSIRGFQEIHESDMLVRPDPATAFVDPFCTAPTLALICDVLDPVLHQPYSRDPRHIARKAELYLQQTGLATVCYIGPELEFFIFDSIRFGQDQHSGYYYVESAEGEWASGRDEGAYGGGNLGYKQNYKGGYFPVPPSDTLQDIRSEIVLALMQAGVQVEVHHHEVATAGQNEIDMRFAPLTRMADNVMMYKYICKNVARRHGKVATFMPKPLFADNASGMHCHQSLWRGGQNLFYDENGWAQTSQMCRWYIGGLLRHAPALMAFCAPSTNSYKRLVPGYEAPVNLAMSQRNRSAAARIPMVSDSPSARRVEFRCPDPSANAYLAFSAMLLAGLDGIENQTDPGDPLDKNIYDLPPEEAASIRQVPGSLEESLSALESDSAFLRKGDVFTEDLIRTWIDYKRTREIDTLKLRPHPWEFHLYFDI
ncbi:type I glutamate--ammonia ligase [Cupriavidus oxalaticus]|uniref:Glutamine synthetase n=1 Tax=Cupriavidus oxalaticus TaxID=96344 RepID=A0A375GHJ2_9BURK|nr:type I glutamate--ammonia ligase [Cupriavidus oxalaticus]QRQ83886.1 type I glutamate--ammonia ligase [Cupriavidus oxalaticus]QRQ92025.1 type I glutamate--ammonia ligase [Cupriavidus oxalaticus]WQD86622.1 type I glutamate--ammonia ligase [Cupriavidus oxalaticus]SPC19380.1 glutamine synthetase [Cupriavidus oxalaticus]